MMKKGLLDELEELSEHLPPNTLDELIDELGGPDNVAEVETVVTVLCSHCVLLVSVSLFSFCSRFR